MFLKLLDGVYIEESERESEEKESISICIEWDLIEWDFPESKNSSMVAKRKEFIKVMFN